MRRLLGVELGELITAGLVADAPAVAHHLECHLAPARGACEVDGPGYG